MDLSLTYSYVTNALTPEGRARFSDDCRALVAGAAFPLPLPLVTRAFLIEKDA